MEMEMAKDFHMNGGIGEGSYSSNSTIQRTVIMMKKEIIEQAIRGLCYSNTNFPQTLTMADLGCSSGPNTLQVASMLINTVAKISLEMGHKSPEIQINLNDLPSNDFNTLFRSLQEFQENLTTQKLGDVHPLPACYFNGVPGSFYDRLFPAKTLHIVHSSFSLHWLSQFPEMGEINKGSIHLSSTTPKNVTRAYYEQFQKDFLTFVRCRSEEMVAGGRMILTLLGRRTDDPCCEENYCKWRPFALALKDMVFEGLVDEEKFDSFNIPMYMASPTEIKNLVEKEGSFTINHLEASDVNCSISRTVHDMAMSVRVVIESLLVNHFGKAILDDVFMRYEKILADRIHIQENEVAITVTISLMKKM